MLGVVGIFSKPLILCVILQVMPSHQIIQRAQPAIILLASTAFNGKVKKAISVKMMAVIIWPIKNKTERKNSMLVYKSPLIIYCTASLKSANISVFFGKFLSGSWPCASVSSPLPVRTKIGLQPASANACKSRSESPMP